jgi:glycosyltransferase involved in cell wall biosynthesis
MLQHRGVASDKLHDIGNAVDTDLFAPTLSKEEIKKRQEGFGIPDNCIVLGWPGRVSAETEILNSLKLLIELKSLNFNHFRFLIIGDGAYLGEVKKFIDNNDLTQYVVYLGWQSIDEMKLCIQLLDVVPLLRADVAGGSKLREAMASGVIALSVNDIGGFQKTWITDGETGVLVSPINFIHNAALRVIELYQNPVLANHIRVQGRKYAVESLAFKNKSKLVQDVCEALCKKQ